jgi:hypothetical protein
MIDAPTSPMRFNMACPKSKMTGPPIYGGN